ncbi:hypothetical protein [Agromyces albus]|uniref:hypothetical protein n=1 Tax=Agromyces albus TaxID=205332 RepID=UPI00278B34BC|nr:hypothetical protein [Agromyces albus]MDQ0576981.1 hypothetical protein [Agromyces albus]
MSNPTARKADATDPAIDQRHSLDGTARRLTGWCGIGMVAAILVNGPLSQVLQRVPSYWNAGAGDELAAYLQDDGNVGQMVVFFTLSNLIFVFAIGFFAGLRRVVSQSGLSDWVSGVVSIGSAIFLAGGLLSETLSTGIAVVLRTSPDYQLDVNSALLLQGLWSTAIAQGQVALGVVIITVSAVSLRAGGLPRWLAWFGVVAGIATILRPVLIADIPLFIASFQPTLLWIAAVSVVLLVWRARRSAAR